MLRASLTRLYLRGRFLLFQRRRHRRLVLEHFAGHPLVVLPEVFNPTLFLTTGFFASLLSPELVPSTADVLDVGTGSGALAIVAAQLARSVAAVDVNPHAVRCARLNVLLNRCEDRVAVEEGDLFGPFNGRRFDVVLCNPPFYRGSPRDHWDASWRAPDFFERFTGSLAAHLAPAGHALVLLSSLAEADAFFTGCAAGGLETAVVGRCTMTSETFSVYRVKRAA
jgi:release factor glutamine methyltransferase